MSEPERSGPFSELLDFWGRGGLCRVAAAVRTDAHRAVAVDAVSIQEIRRWARILCPLFDTVILKSNGPLGDGALMCPLDVDYGGPGGHGYDITNEVIVETSRDPPTPRWAMTVSSASLVPRDVAGFLAGEAMPLVRAGRLVLVPAPLVGCTQTAVGWTDDLFVNGLLGGAVSVVGDTATSRRHGSTQQRILDLNSTVLPFIENVTLPDLARVLQEAVDWLGPLRAVILDAVGSDDLRHERWDRMTVLQHDITDACRELEDRYRRVASATPGDALRVARLDTSVVATERTDELHGPYGQDPADPITAVLRSIAGASRDPAPWIPYWLLKGAGGFLSWTAPSDNRSLETMPDGTPDPPRRPRLPMSSWLHPGTAGFGIRPAIGI
jgi:hypothetical protein